MRNSKKFALFALGFILLTAIGAIVYFGTVEHNIPSTWQIVTIDAADLLESPPPRSK